MATTRRSMHDQEAIKGNRSAQRLEALVEYWEGLSETTSPEFMEVVEGNPRLEEWVS